VRATYISHCIATSSDVAVNARFVAAISVKSSGIWDFVNDDLDSEGDAGNSGTFDKLVKADDNAILKEEEGKF